MHSEERESAALLEVLRATRGKGEVWPEEGIAAVER